jgi:aconitate hydratase
MQHGTMVMLEFEAMQVPWAKTEVPAQYIDHNMLQTDFKNADDYDRIGQGDVLEIDHAVEALRRGEPITLRNTTRNTDFVAAHGLSVRQIEAVLEGGLINVVRKHRSAG